MAKRRNWGAGFAAAAQSSAPLIQYMMQKQRDAAEHARTLERDRLQTEAGRQNTLLSGAINNPEVARKLTDAGTDQAGGVDLSALRPTEADDLTKLTERIRNATSLGELPTLTGIATEARSRGHEDPYFQGPFPEIKIGDKSFGEHAAMPIRPEGEGPSRIQDLIAATQSKEAQLTRMLQTNALGAEHYDPTTGAKVKQVGGMTLQTTPTPGEAGRDQVQQLKAGLGSPEGLGLTTATKEAERLGEYSDKVIDQLVKLSRQQEMARSAADINTARNTTVGERMAGSQLPALAVASADAAALEAKGARFTALTDIAQRSAIANMTINKLGQWIPMFARTPDEVAYGIAAQNFLTTYGKITSGVAIREDEFDKWLISLFGMGGDPPEAVARKAQYRNTLVRAQSITAGLSGPRAGEVLGRLFANGELPRELLYTLDMDPEISQALFKVLSADGSVVIAPSPRRTNAPSPVPNR